MKHIMQPNDPSDFESIQFPNFWIFHSDGGWRWVSNDTTKSSPAAFDSAPFCALNAERTLNRAHSKQ